MSIRPQGRPKNRWEDDIRSDVKKLKIKNWISCIHDRNKWKSYAEKAKRRICGVMHRETLQPGYHAAVFCCVTHTVYFSGHIPRFLRCRCLCPQGTMAFSVKLEAVGSSKTLVSTCPRNCTTSHPRR